MNYSLIIPVVNNFIYNKSIYENIRSQYPSIEIVIVSKSNDKTDSFFKNLNDENLIFQTHNLHTLSEAYNLAVSLSTKEKIILCHNDMVFCPNFIEYIDEDLKEDNILTYTRVEPPVFNDTYAGKEILDCGFDIDNFNSGKFIEHCKENLNEPIDGGSQLFFAVYKNNYLGLDSETFEMFCEDEDIHLRSSILGLKHLVSRKARCYHFVSKTSRAKDNSNIEHQSNINFIKKWGFRNSKHNVCYNKKLEFTNANPNLFNQLSIFFNQIEDILVTVEPSTFTQKDLQILHNINDIIYQDLDLGTYQINNIKIKVNQKKEIQKDLIYLRQNQMINIIYRISDAGYQKEKPEYINNKNCLKNASKVFQDDCSWTVIADNVSPATKSMIESYQSNIDYVSVGHGAGTFNLALDKALKLEDEDVVYFIENDYLHLPNSHKAIVDGLRFTDYVTLYDHPDKYIDPQSGGNPYCEGGAENTRLYCGKVSHWKLTNSTTMTFASKVKTLKADEAILRKYTSSTTPNDFRMFLDLAKEGRKLSSPVPSYSTHGECVWLAPLFDWSSAVNPIVNNS